jgi:putative transposase
MNHIVGDALVASHDLPSQTTNKETTRVSPTHDFKPSPTKENRRRKPLRLKGYDYAQGGAYYVTICTQQRTCFFGDVINGQMVLNEAGQMIQQTWDDLPNHYPNVTLDAFVVMPNHVHGVIFIYDSLVGDALVASHDVSSHNTKGRPQGSPLPTFMDRFKSMTTVEYIRGVKTFGWTPFNGKLWQRGYYDHIVRNEKDLDRIRQYIINNPLQWADDTENPDFTGDAFVTSRKEQHA